MKVILIPMVIAFYGVKTATDGNLLNWIPQLKIFAFLVIDAMEISFLKTI